MKKICAILTIVILASGCTIFKTVSHYHPDPETAETVRNAIASPVNIGEFTDASFRKELTCNSLAIIQAPDNWFYADAIRYALIDELNQAARYDPASRVTITAHLNQIDFETESGSWIIRMTFSSSNGRTMVMEEKNEYGSIPIGEAACTQAAFNYMPTLKKFMQKLLTSPEFAELTKDIPPPQPQEEENTSQILSPEQEAKAEENARKIGRERIRQIDSLESSKNEANYL